MQVYDPIGNRRLPLDACRQLAEFSGYVPVRPRDAHYYFALHMPTGRTCLASEVHGLEEHALATDLADHLAYEAETNRLFGWVGVPHAEGQPATLVEGMAEADLQSRGYSLDEVRAAGDTVSLDEYGEYLQHFDAFDKLDYGKATMFVFDPKDGRVLTAPYKKGESHNRFMQEQGVPEHRFNEVVRGYWVPATKELLIWPVAHGESRLAKPAKAVWRRVEQALGVKPVGEYIIGGTRPDDYLLDPDAAVAESIPAWATGLLFEGVQDKSILKAVFVLGAGGAGKSAIAKVMFGGEGLKDINPDKHLERLLRQRNIPLAKAGQEYGLFAKAKKLRDVEQTQYAKRRLGMVIDITGWDYKRVANPVDELRDLGYDCYCVFVNTSLDTALRRNAARGQQGGRVVPDSYVKDAWHGSQDYLPKYKQLFGKRFFLIDNDKDATPEEWQNEVVPKLRKIGRAILSAPLANPKGKDWVAKGGEPDSTVAPVSAQPKSQRLPIAKPRQAAPRLSRAAAPKTPPPKEGRPSPRATPEPRPLPSVTGRRVNLNPWAPRPYRPKSERSFTAGRRRPAMLPIAESVTERHGIETTPGGTRVWVNPTSQELVAICKRAPVDVEGLLARGLIEKDDLYFWAAHSATHHDVAQALGLADATADRLGVWQDEQDSAVYRIQAVTPSSWAKVAKLFPDAVPAGKRGGKIHEGDASAPANLGAARSLVGYIKQNMTGAYLAQVVRPVALYKAKGVYNRTKAPKLAMHLVMAAGQKKGGEGGQPWHAKFNPKTRAAAEVLVRNAAEKDARAGKANSTLPLKYRPGFKGYKEHDERGAD